MLSFVFNCIVSRSGNVLNNLGRAPYVMMRSCVFGHGVCDRSRPWLDRAHVGSSSLSVIGVSTCSNVSTREGVIYHRVDPHGSSSILQSVPKPLSLWDSATLCEPCCNHSLPLLPPLFTERQMDGAKKPGEQRARWVASSQTVYNTSTITTEKAAEDTVKIMHVHTL